MKKCSFYSCKNETKTKYCSEECRVFGTYKTVSGLKGYIWKLFSQYIKHRDSKNGVGYCITCHKAMDPFTSEAHAGHWLHGDNPGTWTHQKNVHLQCSGCNTYRDGARDWYAIELVRRYGHEILQELERAYHHPPTTWSMLPLREEYRRVAKLYEKLASLH